MIVFRHVTYTFKGKKQKGINEPTPTDASIYFTLLRLFFTFLLFYPFTFTYHSPEPCQSNP